MHVSSRRPHGSLSRPVRLLLRHGLLDSTTSFFDYGCGSGSDLEILARRGIAGEGWDPAMRPHASKVAADVVNLGYVLNVLPSSARPFVLAEAWNLAKGLMVVAVPPVSVLGDVFDVEQTLLDECRAIVFEKDPDACARALAGYHQGFSGNGGTRRGFCKGQH